MNDKIYVIWEQQGIKGIDRCLIPLSDIAKTKSDIDSWALSMVKSIGNGYYEYMSSKKVLKVNKKTGRVVE